MSEYAVKENLLAKTLYDLIVILYIKIIIGDKNNSNLINLICTQL